MTANSELVICPERERLFAAERAFRADAKAMSARDIQAAARVADVCIAYQRSRHAHEASCPVCLQIEARRAAA